MRSTLREEQVKALFSSSSKECDVLIGLLKLAISHWDKVEYILGGQAAHRGRRMAYNLRPLLRFQRKSSQERACSPGGLWLSMGFSVDKNLGPWEVDISGMKFILKK